MALALPSQRPGVRGEVVDGLSCRSARKGAPFVEAKRSMRIAVAAANHGTRIAAAAITRSGIRALAP
ncbi:MAG: hypothetical protein U1F26_16475 [Lysobacterales bacterium]